MTLKAIVCCSVITLCHAVQADEVREHAEAIFYLKEIRNEYLKEANVSGETMRFFASYRAQAEGIAAKCRGVTNEQAGDAAEQASLTLSAEIGPLIKLLTPFSPTAIQEPTLGFYRTHFLSGLGQECSAKPMGDSAQINEAVEAIRSAVAIERDIQRRRRNIVQLLEQQ